jgi:hypothetical protein
VTVLLSVEKTRAWGLWEATALRADGRTVTAGGTSESQARHNALLRVPCASPDCAGTLGPAEANLAVRSCGAARCATCRERAHGPDTEPADD